MNQILHRISGRILHNPSRCVKDSGQKKPDWVILKANPSQSFTHVGEGFGKDLNGLKALINRDISLFLLILHYFTPTPARDVRTCVRGV